MITRRRLLAGTAGAAGAVGLLGAATGCGALLAPRGSVLAQVGRVLPSTAPLPKPYQVELPRVPVVRPDASGRLTMTQRPAQLEILPGLTTEVWGYEGRFPGPTIEARKGRPVTLQVRNELPTPTSTHLHGGVTPADSDGGPLDLVVPSGFDTRHLDVAMANAHGHGEEDDGAGGATPSATRSHGHSEDGDHDGHGGHGGDGVSDIWTLHPRRRDYHYPMVQDAALLWYHDHRMDFSAPQVWRGLAGMFVVRDDTEDALELPSGDRELTLMLTDRSFGDDGELLYPGNDPSLTTEPGVTSDYMDGVLGDVMLVNGAPSPYTRVTATSLRLRLLNACNARALRLRFQVPGQSDLAFHQIGTDIGLMAAPMELTVLDLHPAERADLLLDLSAVPVGTEVELTNDSDDPTAPVLKLIIDRDGPKAAPVPTVLRRDFDLLSESSGATHRHFDFRLGGGHVWMINGQPYDPRASLAEPPLDTVERWTFSSDFNHPVHVHLGHFQVIEEYGKEVPEEERGWKDTVNVAPYGTVDVLIRFTDFTGVYMLHCHNLEHEDMAMMANFTVV